MDIKTGDTQDDKMLVAKILDGDQQAFSRLIKNTERLVTQIVFKMIASAEDRKDIAQETYIKVFRKLRDFRFQSRLSTWIAQIAYSTCFDHLRKKKLPLLDLKQDDSDEDANLELKDPYAAGDTTLLKKDLAKLLEASIAKLPPVYRTLIGLYHTEELSYEEIMQVTGLPEGTVKNYLYRARKALRLDLSEHYKKEEL